MNQHLIMIQTLFSQISSYFHRKTSKISKRNPETYISNIWYSTPRLIRFYSTERIVLRSCTLLRQQIEQRALPHIWQAHTSHLEILPDTAEGDNIVLRLFDSFLRWHVDVEVRLKEI